MMFMLTAMFFSLLLGFFSQFDNRLTEMKIDSVWES